MGTRNLFLTKERKECRLAEKPGRQRSIQGLTQREVAQEASIDDSTVQSYELWKDGLHDHFCKRDYPAIYPDYDPMKPDSGQRWISERFAYDLKDMRRIRGLNQEEIAEKMSLSLFTLCSYEQGKRMLSAKQMEALCEAPGITSTALKRHYFGSPNQAMRETQTAYRLGSSNAKLIPKA